MPDDPERSRPRPHDAADAVAAAADAADPVRSGAWPPARDVLVAIVVGATLSGAPSTLEALVRRRDPLAAATAAGSLLGVEPRPRGRALAAGAVVHGAVSTLWGIVLARLLPPGRRTITGALAGAAIYVLDLEVIARVARIDHVRALPRLGQLGDHVAFGALVGAVLDHAERTRNTG